MKISLRILALALVLGTASVAAAAPDVVQIIGEKSGDFTPKVVLVLKRGMTPEEAGKVLPGAETVDKFGFASIKKTGVPGVAEYRLYYAKDKKDGIPKELQGITLTFDESFEGEAGFAQILKACEAKFGPAKPDQVAKKLVTWVGPHSAIAQLVSNYHTGKGWMLKMTLPRP